MVDPTAQHVGQRSAALLVGGRLTLTDAVVNALGGDGSWIDIEVLEGVVTLRTSAIDENFAQAFLALPLDNDET